MKRVAERPGEERRGEQRAERREERGGEESREEVLHWHTDEMRNCAVCLSFGVRGVEVTAKRTYYVLVLVLSTFLLCFTIHTYIPHIKIIVLSSST